MSNSRMAPTSRKRSLRSSGCISCENTVIKNEFLCRLVNMPLENISNAKLLVNLCKFTMPRKGDDYDSFIALVVHTIVSHPTQEVVEELVKLLPKRNEADPLVRRPSSCIISLMQDATKLSEGPDQRNKIRLFLAASLVLIHFPENGMEILKVGEAMVRLALDLSETNALVRKAFEILWMRIPSSRIPDFVASISDLTYRQIEKIGPFFRLHWKGEKAVVRWTLEKLKSGRFMNDVVNMCKKPLEEVDLRDVKICMLQVPAPYLHEGKPEWDYITDFFIYMNSIHTMSFRQEAERHQKTDFEDLVIFIGKFKDMMGKEADLKYLTNLQRWYGAWSGVKESESSFL